MKPNIIYRKSGVLLMWLCCLCFTAGAQLSGTYTINSLQPTAGRNYISFNAAAADLAAQGVSGPVVFDVAVGTTYNGQVTITQINGASRDNRIVFNGNGATLFHTATAAAQRPAIILNGADYITIDSLNIDMSASAQGIGIKLHNQADYNIITRCTIKVSTTNVTNAQTAGIVIANTITSSFTTGTGAGDNANHVVIEKNTIIGGYIGIVVRGPSANGVYNDSNRISNNIIQDPAIQGMYINNQVNAQIYGNDISRPTRTTAFTTGIYLATSGSNNVIGGNRIHDLFTSASSINTLVNGISISEGHADPLLPNIIENNLMYNNLRSNGETYGIVANNFSNVHVRHNTVVIGAVPDLVSDTTNAPGTGRGISIQGVSSSGAHIVNNIVCITTGIPSTGNLMRRSAMWIASPANNIAVCDNNVFYVRMSGIGATIVVTSSPSANFETLDDWQQSAYGYDNHSVAANPAFVDPDNGNFMPWNPDIHDIGAPAGVMTDITGQARSVTTPDPGAYEFIPSPCSGTPVTGTVTVSDLQVCALGSLSLGLDGHSHSPFQTYEWESSPTETPFVPTSLGAPGITPGLTISPIATLWYRAKVTCASTVYSDPVRVTVAPPLTTGSYTIDNTQPTAGNNFNSFADAVAAMSCGGIAGPVTFNLNAGGTYMEQLSLLQPIYGTSPTNTITFRGNGATIGFPFTTSVNRAVIHLREVNYVRIENMIIDGSIGAFGRGLELTNADHNVISGCTIILDSVAAGGNYDGVYTSNAGDNVFEENTVIGGSYGIQVGAGRANTVIRNNILRNQFGNGIQGVGDTIVISGNDISAPSRTERAANAFGISAAPVFGTANNVILLIEKNRVYDMFTSAPSSAILAGGIRIQNYETVSGTIQADVENNLIYNNGHNGTFYGVRITTSDSIRVRHNTILIDGAGATGGAGYGCAQDDATSKSARFENNIISITKGGSGAKYAIYNADYDTTLYSDHNVLHLNSAGTGAVYTGLSRPNSSGGWVSYSTLAGWQSGTGLDTASVAEDPLFMDASAGNLVPRSLLVNNTGAVGTGVAADYTGAVRGAAPDPGAYEFNPPACTQTPVPGSAATSISVACKGELVTLSLNGNTTAVNQLYEWESSPVETPFTPTSVSQPSTDPEFRVNALEPLWYRVKLTCGSTVVYSAPVQVGIVTPLAAGAYTVDPAQPTAGNNYNSLQEAADALTCAGIAGPVVFDVSTATYNEQVAVGEIHGVSAANTVTFKGNGARIEFNGVTDKRYGILLNGSDYVTLDSFIIDGAAGDFAYGILLTNGADHNTITGNRIDVSKTNTSSNAHAGIVASGSLTSFSSPANEQVASFTRITGNRIVGGAHGISLSGNSNGSSTGNLIEGNIIEDAPGSMIYTDRQKNCAIRDNDLSRPGSTYVSAATYGIRLLNDNDGGNLVENNRIHDLFMAIPTSTSICYGISIGSGFSNVLAPNIIRNNLFWNNIHEGAVYGIYVSNLEHAGIYHNTLLLNGASATAGIAVGYYQSNGPAGVDFRNNIISITKGGSGLKHGLWFNETTDVFTSDNNVIHLNSGGAGAAYTGRFGTSGSGNYTTLSDWQTVTGQDGNSVAVDPLFTSIATGNLLPGNATLDNTGALVGVREDILGVLRSNISPDPGAYEFGIIIRTDSVTIHDTICNNQLPYLWEGKTVYAAGAPADTILRQNQAGHDSLVVLHLVVNDTIATSESLTICSNDLPYIWNGETVSTPGFNAATARLQNAAGCDSVVTLHLAVTNVITATVLASICNNQLPYTWNGQQVSAGGAAAATATFTNASGGCDSIVTLNLTVRDTVATTHDITICSNQLPYAWNGQSILAGGMAVATARLQNMAGCDSVVTLNLAVNNTSAATEQITICRNELPYSWHGQSVTSGGATAATVTLSNGTGCDSVVTLDLMVNDTSATTEQITICRNELPYTWNGQTVSAGGSNAAVIRLVNGTGCDSVVTLDLTVNDTFAVTDAITICRYDLPYTWNGQTLTDGGDAVATATFQAVEGCDSVVTLDLSVETIDTTVTRDAVSLTSSAGGAFYQWINCGNNTPVDGATDQKYTPAFTGSYAVMVMKNGCSDTSGCYTVMVQNSVSDVASGQWIRIAPNPTMGIVHIRSDYQLTKATIRLSNMLGQTLRTRSDLSGDSFVWDLGGYAAGIYIIEVQENERVVKIKLVKE